MRWWSLLRGLILSDDFDLQPFLNQPLFDSRISWENGASLGLCGGTMQHSIDEAFWLGGTPPGFDALKDYDLLAVDQANFRVALDHDTLLPLDKIFGQPMLRNMRAASIGRSWDMFTASANDKRVNLGLPIHVTADVMAWRGNFADDEPTTWLSLMPLACEGQSNLCFSGAQAFRTILSMFHAVGGDLTDPNWPSSSLLFQAMMMLTLVPSWRFSDQQPAELLDRLDTGEIPFVLPLVPADCHALMACQAGEGVRFANPVMMGPKGVIGTCLNGAALALPKIANKERLKLVRDVALDVIEQLYIGKHDASLGLHPVRQDLWESDNTRYGERFYSDIAMTVEHSALWPWRANYRAFEQFGGAVMRGIHFGSMPLVAGMELLQKAWAGNVGQASQLKRQEMMNLLTA